MGENRGTLLRARISGSLSCIRPAVSTRTTSKRESRAEIKKQERRSIKLPQDHIELVLHRTVVDSFHCNTSRVFTVAFLVELHHLSTVVCRWRMQSVELALVRAQLFDSACAKRVTRGNQHAQVVFDQPKGNLKG